MINDMLADPLASFCGHGGTDDFPASRAPGLFSFMDLGGKERLSDNANDFLWPIALHATMAAVLAEEADRVLG